jgi:UDP-galactopyranose mutase
LDGIDTRTGCDYFNHKSELDAIADKIVYTGPIDQYFNYCYGRLEYRTVTFEQETLDTANHQGVAVMNYTDAETPYTRIIEHKHFEFGTQEKTVISKEYSSEWKDDSEPYYPINNERNTALYHQYKALADKEENVIFGGRLAEYKYYDMHHVVEQVLNRPEFNV